MNLKAEVPELLSRTNASDGKKRKEGDAGTLKSLLAIEASETLLLRCLLRESGQDIKDGLHHAAHQLLDLVHCATCCVM